MPCVWCLVPGSYQTTRLPDYQTTRRQRPLTAPIHDRSIAENSINLILSRHLVGYAKAYLDAEVDFSTISKAMKRCGLRTGRSKLRVGSPDPDYIVKRQTVEQLRSLQQRGN